MDPNIMSQVMQQMQDPQFRENMMSMMQNPEIQNMLSDPNTMDKIFGSQDFKKSTTENNETEFNFKKGEKVKIIGVNNPKFNNKEGIIKNFDNIKKRIHIKIEESIISVEQKNIENIYEYKEDSEEESEEESVEESEEESEEESVEDSEVAKDDSNEIKM